LGKEWPIIFWRGKGGGGWAISKNKKSCTANISEKDLCKRIHAWGIKFKQVLSTIQILCLILKKGFFKLLPTTKDHAQPKGEKIKTHAPENCPTHLKK